MVALASVTDLIRTAVALGADQIPGWSQQETRLVREHLCDQPPLTPEQRRELQEAIAAGDDPLGSAYARIRSPEERRPLGQTYTPTPIIASMLDWAADARPRPPARVIDPGAGSGRYLLAAARRFPHAALLAVEVDPLAALMTRANLAATGTHARAQVLLVDYRALPRDPVEGPTLYVGNPPYVRHHNIDAPWKQWLLATAKQRGLSASALAGLHVHFFLATAEHARAGDFGAFVTSAEWLDVNYGRLARQLLLDGLDGLAVHVLEPQAAPFADAITTAAITCFHLGRRPATIRFRRVETVSDLGRLDRDSGHPVARQRLTDTDRWSALTRLTPKLPSGYVELGELCRVHRGAATGANDFWVTKPEHTDLPSQVLFPAVTKARELFAAGERLVSVDGLRCVINLPEDLDEFDPADLAVVKRFLKDAHERGIPEGYLASKRKTWWTIGLRSPAPILATYMARRPPAFVRNDVEAHYLNIAHGLYPRSTVDLDVALLDRLAAHLRTAVTQAQGRTYAGGLTKFEPKEMERLPVPDLETLAHLAHTRADDAATAELDAATA